MDHAAGNVEPIKGDSTVRIDLQDIYRANPKAFIVACAVIVAAFGFLVVKGVSSGGSSRTTATSAARSTRTTSPSTGTTTAAGVTTPDPNYHPVYQSVPQTPALQAMETKLGGLPPQAAAVGEALATPAPTWTRSYPAVSGNVLSDPTGYAVAFTQELLDRDYARQPRSEVLSWSQAEAAAELLPGIPDPVAQKTLYIGLTDPSLAGLTGSPVPSASTWATDAKAGVTQAVYSVLAQPNPTWSQIESEGFQSRDPLMTMYDVTGVLSTTTGKRTMQQHFTLVLGLGSALHHRGFGAFAIAQWQVG